MNESMRKMTVVIRERNRMAFGHLKLQSLVHDGITEADLAMHSVLLQQLRRGSAELTG